MEKIILAILGYNAEKHTVVCVHLIGRLERSLQKNTVRVVAEGDKEDTITPQVMID